MNASRHILQDAFDGLVLSGADGDDFYRLAMAIDPEISPQAINDEIGAAFARWQDAASKGAG